MLEKQQRTVQFTTLTEILGSNVVGSQAVILNGGSWGVTINSSQWQTQMIEVESAFVSEMGQEKAHIPVNIYYRGNLVKGIFIDRDKGIIELWGESEIRALAIVDILESNRLSTPIVLTTFDGEGTSFVSELAEALELTVCVTYTDVEPVVREPQVLIPV